MNDLFSVKEKYMDNNIPITQINLFMEYINL